MTTGTDTVAGSVVRWRVTVRGVVQGVGFRPHVHRLATELGLTGRVTNTAAGVVCEVEGVEEAVRAFGARVGAQAPAAAVVEDIAHRPVTVRGDPVFTIEASEPGGGGRTLLPPDTATCADCLRELRDPTDRRHRHPFISCTHCGPRLTIATALPYDRATTTMAGFPMCARCAREYADPADRRFHAQPIACHDCGPRLRLVGADGSTLPTPEDVAAADPVAAARALLACGGVVAVKGLGGYHLACDAQNEDAVRALRDRKRRGGKPFAVMAASPDDLAHLVHLDDTERALLSSPARPVVLLRRRNRPLPAPHEAPTPCAAVASGSPDLGVLLPYTPLHHLLLGLPGDPAGPRLLVMTSGNLSGEPLVSDDEEARERLAGLADAWLFHDRPIRVPCDDSVARVWEDAPLLLRRARGYAPLPVPLPVSVAPVLAAGGDLKNTCAVAEGRLAWLSPHVGDMDDLATQRVFERARRQLGMLTGVRPTAVAVDLHPGYRSAAAGRRVAAGRPVVAVQHHHAHVAAVMAENGLGADERVLGVAFDGTGYGEDGAVWGGEVLLADYAGHRRLAHLRYVPLPGGEAAIRRPYRMALAHLWAGGVPWSEELPCVRACPEGELRVLRRQLETGLNCVATSSMGRLFDAVASLAGVCQRVDHEAQAAVALEAAARRAVEGAGSPYAFALRDDAEGGAWVADAGPVLAAVAADVRAGVGVERIASGFHTAVATIVRDVCRRAREEHGVGIAALTGGAFANPVLATRCARLLREDGLRVLRHRLVPPGDGGLALGQAVVAAHRPATGAP